MYIFYELSFVIFPRSYNLAADYLWDRLPGTQSSPESLNTGRKSAKYTVINGLQILLLLSISKDCTNLLYQNSY